MDNEKQVVSNHHWLSKCKIISKCILTYYFYLHIILLIIIAIIQLRFSLVYDDQCTIDDRIVLYLLVFSIIQIIYSFNGVLLIIFSLLYEKYTYFNYFLFIDFLIHLVIVVILFICFIIGNYLVFPIHDDVQYTNSYNTRTYCDYKLYQTAFWTTIIYYILIILFSIVLVLTNLKWFVKQLKKLKENVHDEKQITPKV